MKAYCRSGGIVECIPDLGTRWCRREKFPAPAENRTPIIRINKYFKSEANVLIIEGTLKLGNKVPVLDALYLNTNGIQSDMV